MQKSGCEQRGNIYARELGMAVTLIVRKCLQGNYINCRVDDFINIFVCYLRCIVHALVVNNVVI